VIGEFARAVRHFIKFDPPYSKPYEWMGLKDYLKMLPYLLDYMRYRKISVFEFSKKFKDTFLRQMFPVVFPPELPMLLAIFKHRDYEQTRRRIPHGWLASIYSGDRKKVHRTGR
jgi:hypothetical protein